MASSGAAVPTSKVMQPPQNMRVHGGGPAGVDIDHLHGEAGHPTTTHAEEGDGVGVYCVLSGEVEILNADMSETLTKVAAGNIACAYVISSPGASWTMRGCACARVCACGCEGAAAGGDVVAL